MFKLSTKIEIKGSKTWAFDKVAAVEITRDSETITDTCTVELPRKVKWEGAGSNPLKRGDEITVWLGYDDNLQLAFRGFVTVIGLKTPIKIECEDYMFTLKKKAAVKKAYASATLTQILQDQDLGDMTFKVEGEQNIGQYRVTANTVSELLSHLKDNGIRSFVRLENGKPVLYCGVLFDKEKGYRQVFATGVNIIDDTQLKNQNKEDVLLKVRAISLAPDNSKKCRVEVGDADGEVRTIHAYNKDKAALKKWAEQELERLKRDGLVGSFTTFGAEIVDKLDNVAIKIDGERKGVYRVTKNIIKFGTGGFRQEITIGGRVSQ